MNIPMMKRWADGLRRVHEELEEHSRLMRQRGETARTVFSLETWTAFYNEFPMEWQMALIGKGVPLTVEEMRGCSFAGCAVGWLPGIMPDRFAWTTYAPHRTWDLEEQAEVYDNEVATAFELTQDQVTALIYEDAYDMIPPPYSNVTALMVAERIEEMVRRAIDGDPEWVPGHNGELTTGG